MENEFNFGLAIGGPLAGQMVCRQGTSYKYNNDVYKFKRLIFGGPFYVREFWVLEDFLTNENYDVSICDELIRVYMESANAK